MGLGLNLSLIVVRIGNVCVSCNSFWRCRLQVSPFHRSYSYVVDYLSVCGGTNIDSFFTPQILDLKTKVFFIEVD